MGKTLRFWGEGGDLPYYGIETDQTGTVEELDGEYAILGVLSKEGMLKVVLRYGDAGPTWTVAPVIWDEAEPLPDWPMDLDVRPDEINNSPYSMILIIQAPDDAKVVVLEKGNT